ncbi:helix-turn-helix domain-containing protein [uncultured Citricoccus sp.]|uniref:helix-turn-helix domain-containing protein n=1 Tax=uncultured Citricoccus sp. TaxID=614031 RepID=UPI0026041E4A|nr:helix-turn-helix domain-containing protein [uncultured Citricoccus sp.]
MNDPEVVDTLLEGQPELLTTDEICTLMRVSQGTVLRWMKDQKLPVISVGPRLRRVQLSRFREWLLQADEIKD